MSAFVFVVPQPGESVSCAGIALSPEALFDVRSMRGGLPGRGDSHGVRTFPTFDNRKSGDFRLRDYRQTKMHPLPDLHCNLLLRGAAVFGTRDDCQRGDGAGEAGNSVLR